MIPAGNGRAKGIEPDPDLSPSILDALSYIHDHLVQSMIFELTLMFYREIFLPDREQRQGDSRQESRTTLPAGRESRLETDSESVIPSD